MKVKQMIMVVNKRQSGERLRLVVGQYSGVVSFRELEIILIRSEAFAPILRKAVGDMLHLLREEARKVILVLKLQG